DIYINDFMVLAQRPQHLPTLNRLLHALHDIFHDPPDTLHRQVISTSKLAKGDDTFSTQKRILGWDMDSSRMTLALPQDRLDNLITMISDMLQKLCTSKRK
ncbi:MAG: hypothetical protein ACK55I_13015, partial [bacterium]